MSARLAGKTVVITGASSGIGRSTAMEFAQTCPHDLKLVLTARRTEALQELESQIHNKVGKGVKIHCHKMDISNSKEVAKFVEDLPNDFKDVDVLVNNA